MLRNSIDQLASEKRRGFLVGMAVAELMVLILLALILFLLSREKIEEEKNEIIDLIGGTDSMKIISEAIAAVPGGKNLFSNPENVEVIIKVTNQLLAQDSQMDAETLIAKLTEELERIREENAELKDARDNLVAQINMERARSGETTPCAYQAPESLSEIRGSSVPIAYVKLEEPLITFIKLGYDDGLVDPLGEPFVDSTASILGNYYIGQTVDLQELSALSAALAADGDSYRTDTRQNCRHYFAYYSENDLNASFKDRFDALAWTDVKISEQTFKEISFSGVNFDYLPLIKPNPDYPRNARRREIEGSVTVRFSIDASGEVIEETILIIESNPQDVFDQSALDAIMRAKFQPRIVDGVATITPNLGYRFIYQMERSGL